ncbi:hypothetical protein PENPOL_c004G02060 [Penicillium polonicum]|uniref:SET domain-containing protein n=1 Tax=Penicillium polonicum TaxID=60169 RepID=A0A1V6NCV0_PENPO|nr:hypothetical protein PENPOL_c023G04395 [Penicillium polonicum]OQD62276.1 hypothetical protein PENPOL_c013G05975 [Penicillium polonicum]OQD66693.1 hypothetical protein PENPOL_c004G02060 [Penicillium polonicum]
MSSHPYYRLQLPHGASFELKPSQGKGWGAFATSRIERGSIILRERALFVIRDSSPEVIENCIVAAACQLSPNQKAQLLLLRDNGSKEFANMLHMLAENSFSSTNEPPDHGLFVLASRFNHSCLPNAMIPSTRADAIELYATKDIEAGEEIYFCYSSDLKAQTKYERHEYLDFSCDCKACMPGTPFQELSDLRRRLIRGLLYILRGVDLDGKIQTSQSPVIVDPELKAAAETRNIPLTSRMVLHLLIVVFLEEEGLLDDWGVEILERGVIKPVALFLSTHNHQIGELALAQDAWTKKLEVVFQLYGRKDPADDMITQMFQRASQAYAGGRPMPAWS